MSQFNAFFEGDGLISDRQLQDYQSRYLDIYQEMKPKVDDKKEYINDDIVFEIELIKQVEINIDYILMLVKKYQKDGNKNKEILVDIEKAINSSVSLRSKVQLIKDFINTVDGQSEVDKDWVKFVDEQRKKDLEEIITEQKLKAEATNKFIENSFRDGVLKTTGTDFDNIMPPVSRFGNGGNNRAEKRKKVVEKLKEYFEKYSEIVNF